MSDAALPQRERRPRRSEAPGGTVAVGLMDAESQRHREAVSDKLGAEPSVLGAELSGDVDAAEQVDGLVGCTGTATSGGSAAPACDAVGAAAEAVTPQAAATVTHAAGEGEGAAAGKRQAEVQPPAGGQAPGFGPVGREPPPEGQEFEYLDHTADVQIHAWGATLEEAYANAGLAMLNYMTPIDEKEETTEWEYEAQGHDIDSLLFGFLDELLFVFLTELHVCRSLRVTALDRNDWTIRAVGRGEKFDRSRHISGTEVKAITYSAMQINEPAAGGPAELYVIVDI